MKEKKKKSNKKSEKIEEEKICLNMSLCSSHSNSVYSLILFIFVVVGVCLTGADAYMRGDAVWMQLREKNHQAFITDREATEGLGPRFSTPTKSKWALLSNSKQM